VPPSAVPHTRKDYAEYPWQALHWRPENSVFFDTWIGVFVNISLRGWENTRKKNSELGLAYVKSRFLK
jgi:hypothetical protein